MSSKTIGNLKCEHGNICLDNGEGWSVCRDCGEILEPVYLYNHSYVNKQTANESRITKNKQEEKNATFLNQRKEEIDLITTLCEKWHFPNYIINNTKNLYLSLIQNKQNKLRYHKKNIFAFAFYKTLISNNCSHSIHEICHLFGITSLKIFSKIGFEHKFELPPNIKDFLNRFCSNLELNFQQRKDIFKILQNIKFPANLRPETVCAIIILHYHEKNNLKLKKKEIAKNCEITYQTLMKNYYKYKHIFISLL